MEVASSKSTASFAIRAMKLPFQGLWLLVKHPVAALIMVLLIAFSCISFLAHFNPAIAERFSSAAIYFGAATLTSTISDTLRLTERKLGSVSTDLIETKSKLKTANLELRLTERKLESVSTDLIETKSKLKTANLEIADFKNRKAKFASAGKRIEKQAIKRFRKVALYDVAGEFLGWIPIAGDAVSLGLTAGGIYEMCQMFKEIEQATAELGVPYQVYTDTFCEKPVEKTKEIIAEKTGDVKGKIIATTTVFKDYAKNIPVPDNAAFSAKIKSNLDRAYTRIGRLINGN